MKIQQQPTSPFNQPQPATPCISIVPVFDETIEQRAVSKARLDFAYSHDCRLLKPDLEMVFPISFLVKAISMEISNTGYMGELGQLSEEQIGEILASNIRPFVSIIEGRLNETMLNPTLNGYPGNGNLAAMLPSAVPGVGASEDWLNHVKHVCSSVLIRHFSLLLIQALSPANSVGMGGMPRPPLGFSAPMATMAPIPQPMVRGSGYEPHPADRARQNRGNDSEYGSDQSVDQRPDNI